MAGVTRDTGYKNYSSTGTSKFIPQIWSGKLVEKFYNSTVMGEIANTDYEGEVSSQGDKVIIRTTPNITINAYKVGQTLVNEVPEQANVELNIDKANYFSVIVDDVDSYQSDLSLMDNFSEDAAQQLKIAVDSEILTYVAANAGATVGAGTDVSASNVLDHLLMAGEELDGNNIPETGRWAVINPTVARYIKSSDLKDASLAGDGTSIMRNGRLGMIDRFTLYLSNQLPAGVALAGHKAGLTFASQISKVETLKSESKFGQIVRGLNVYGRQVINADALVNIDLTAA